MQHAKDLHSVEANAIDNDKWRTRHDQFAGATKAAAAAKIGVIGKVFHRLAYSVGHTLRGGGLCPGDVFSSFPKVV
jgi:hypothetical protein